MITLADIFEALINSRPEGTNSAITDAVIDSRLAIPGSMFIALPGENVDGHAYVEAALKNGAQVALVQKDIISDHPIVDLRSVSKQQVVTTPDQPFYIRVENCMSSLHKIAHHWRSKLNIKVIGITGSVGKSTTKEIIAGVLSQKYRVIKNPGNYNNEIGLPLTILNITNGYQIAVLEMGFYVPGEISLLCKISLPHVGVITNIGTVHAERAGSQEVIRRGKAELLESLPPNPDGFAVLNFDDPMVKSMAEYTTAKVIYYGTNPEADIWAEDVIGLGIDGIRFTIHYQNESLSIRVPLIGRHSVHTALRAVAVGLVEKLSWEEIINGLQKSHSQLRLATVNTESGALILDDSYNASPQSTLAALNLLEEIEGNKIAVLGDMLELGQYERQGHQMVGVRAAEICDELILVGKLGEITRLSAISNGMSENKIHLFENASEVVAYLKTRLKKEDVVLVKGSHGLRLDRVVSSLEVSE